MPFSADVGLHTVKPLTCPCFSPPSGEADRSKEIRKMYGIPPDIDLSPVVGEMIERVDVGPHIMHINFGNGWSISCEGTVAYRDESGNSLIRDRDWQDLNAIKPLLGAIVLSWQIESDRTFLIFLQDRGAIIFTDDSSQYESFQIWPKGWII